MWEAKFHTHKKQQEKLSSVYINIYIYGKQTERQMSLTINSKSWKELHIFLLSVKHQMRNYSAKLCYTDKYKYECRKVVSSLKEPNKNKIRSTLGLKIYT